MGCANSCDCLKQLLLFFWWGEIHHPQAQKPTGNLIARHSSLCPLSARSGPAVCWHIRWWMCGCSCCSFTCAFWFAWSRWHRISAERCRFVAGERRLCESWAVVPRTAAEPLQFQWRSFTTAVLRASAFQWSRPRPVEHQWSSTGPRPWRRMCCWGKFCYQQPGSRLVEVEVTDLAVGHLQMEQQQWRLCWRFGGRPPPQLKGTGSEWLFRVSLPLPMLQSKWFRSCSPSSPHDKLQKTGSPNRLKCCNATVWARHFVLWSFRKLSSAGPKQNLSDLSDLSAVRTLRSHFEAVLLGIGTSQPWRHAWKVKASIAWSQPVLGRCCTMSTTSQLDVRWKSVENGWEGRDLSTSNFNWVRLRWLAVGVKCFKFQFHFKYVLLTIYWLWFSIKWSGDRSIHVITCLIIPKNQKSPEMPLFCSGVYKMSNMILFDKPVFFCQFIGFYFGKKCPNNGHLL